MLNERINEMRTIIANKLNEPVENVHIEVNIHSREKRDFKDTLKKFKELMGLMDYSQELRLDYVGNQGNFRLQNDNYTEDCILYFETTDSVELDEVANDV